MRQVFRGPTPSPLAGDLSAAYEKIRAGDKADAGIYRHAEVVTSLCALYLEKCFLCECGLPSRQGEVEHFLPWHSDYPERAYEWTNLHWSCFDCNQRKRRKEYRFPASNRKPATRTALLDPSMSSSKYLIKDMIGFNENREAINLYDGTDSELTENVKNTVNFLNDARPLSQRHKRYTELSQALFEANCSTEWKELIALLSAGPIDLGDFPNEKKILYSEALRKADGIFEIFLFDRSPFFTCINQVLYTVYRLSVADFRRMSDAYRRNRDIPLLKACVPYPVAPVSVTAGAGTATPGTTLTNSVVAVPATDSPEPTPTTSADAVVTVPTTALSE